MGAPWSRTKAARRVQSPDEAWAREIRMRLIADAHPWQRDAILDPHELVSMRVGRGGAKTTTKRARAIIKLTALRDQHIGFAATSKDQAHDLMWGAFKRACDALGMRSQTTNVTTKQPDMHYLDSKLVATCLRTGSVYKLRGVEDKRDAEKFRGFPQSEFAIDEAGSQPPELLRYLIEDCVQPRIGEAMNVRFLDDEGDQIEIVRGGCIVMGSTPPAQLGGLFYEATKPSGELHRPYRERAERTAEWSSHEWTLADVVALDDAEQKFPALWHLWLKALKRKEDKGWADDHPVWCREYLGRWAADYSTTVFRFHPDRNLWAPYGDRKIDGIPQLKAAIRALPSDVGQWRYVVTMDNGGTRDPYAANVFAFAPADPDRRLFHVFCHEGRPNGVKPFAEMLVGEEAVKRILNQQDPEPYGGIFAVIGWPDGLEFDADQAVIDELGNVYGIACKKSDRKFDYKFGAVELVNGDLMADKRIQILAGTPLHEQIMSLRWKQDEHERLKEDPGQANHCTDCLIYAHRLVANLYESGQVGHEVAAKQAAPTKRVEDPPEEPEIDQDLLSDGRYDDYDDGDWGNY